MDEIKAHEGQTELTDLQAAEDKLAGYIKEIEAEKDQMLKTMQDWTFNFQRDLRDYPDDISLAQIDNIESQTNSSVYSYGSFAALALSAAVAAYYYNKENKTATTLNERNDSEFLLV